MTTTRHPAPLSAYARPTAGALISRLFSFFIILLIAASMLLSATAFSRVPHVLVVICLVLLVAKSVHAPLRLQLDATVFVGAAFLIYAVASVLWSVNQAGALVNSIGLAVTFAAATLIWAALQNGVSLKLVAWTVASAASVQALIALYQNTTLGMPRAEGLTGNANALALQLSLAAFLLLLAVPRDWRASILAIALIVVATATTGTRKLVFVWFAYVLIVLRSFVPLFRKPSVGAALVLILAPVAVWASLTYAPVLGIGEALEDVTFFKRVTATVTEGKSTDVRSAMITDGLQVWWSKPVFGYGIDQYRYVGKFTTYSHNNYVELLSTLGVVGALLYYLMFVIIGFRAVRGVLAGRQSAWVVSATLVVLLLMDVARVSYSDRFTWIHLLVLALLTTDQARSGAYGDLDG